MEGDTNSVPASACCIRIGAKSHSFFTNIASDVSYN